MPPNENSDDNGTSTEAVNLAGQISRLRGIEETSDTLIPISNLRKKVTDQVNQLLQEGHAGAPLDITNDMRNATLPTSSGVVFSLNSDGPKLELTGTNTVDFQRGVGIALNTLEEQYHDQAAGLLKSALDAFDREVESGATSQPQPAEQQPEPETPAESSTEQAGQTELTRRAKLWNGTKTTASFGWWMTTRLSVFNWFKPNFWKFNPEAEPAAA